jgi:hypothetical protein
MENAKANATYPRTQAASLICACYNQFGSNLDKQAMEKSILDLSLTTLPDS